MNHTDHSDWYIRHERALKVKAINARGNLTSTCEHPGEFDISRAAEDLARANKLLKQFQKLEHKKLQIERAMQTVLDKSNGTYRKPHKKNCQCARCNLSC